MDWIDSAQSMQRPRKPVHRDRAKAACRRDASRPPALGSASWIETGIRPCSTASAASQLLAGVAAFHFEAALPPWRWWPAVFWTCCALMLATFYAPPLPFGAEPAWAMTVPPILVLSGARTVLRARSCALALLAGQLSYLIYVLHHPLFIWVNGIFQTAAHRREIVTEGIILVGAAILLSLLALRVYDEPPRDRLNFQLRRRAGAPHPTTGGSKQIAIGSAHLIA